MRFDRQPSTRAIQSFSKHIKQVARVVADV